METTTTLRLPRSQLMLVASSPGEAASLLKEIQCGADRDQSRSEFDIVLDSLQYGT